MVFKEHERIVLTSDVAGDQGEELKPGDADVIIHIHPRAEAFVVDFFALEGETAAIATVLPSQMRPVTGKEITHARDFALAA